MASTSSGVDWNPILNCLLSSSSSSLPQNDVLELVKAITKSESDFLQPDAENDVFFKALAALSAECISASIHTFSKSQVGLACKASRILLRFILPRLLQTHGSKEVVAGSICLSTKQLILPIKSLCTAKATLPNSDFVALLAVLASAKFPVHWKKPAGEKEATTTKDAKKPRTNLSFSFVEQLTTPLFDFSLVKSSPSQTDSGKPGENSSVNLDNVGAREIEKIFIQTNIATLQALKGGELMTALCLDAPFLSRYIQKYKEALSSGKVGLPTTHSEATIIRHNVQAVASDVHLVASALSLQIFEPLDATRLEELSIITMSCLYCAVCVASASSILASSSAVSPKCSSSGTTANKTTTGEEECLDGLAVGLVEKALEIYSTMSEMIRNSTRTGGDVLQNHRLLGVWILLSGLQAQLSTSNFSNQEKVKEEKGKSPIKAREGSSRVLLKVQQGFGVLSVALASLCLQLMSALLDDLLVECAAQEGSQLVSSGELSILGKNSALQRAAKFLAVAPLNQLLFYLATITYRKAWTLKRIQKAPAEGEGLNSTFSDSGTYYEEDLMSCSESSSGDEDEDSDRILGLWFEETLAPTEPATVPTNSGPQVDTAVDDSVTPGRTDSLVPDKGEPYGYIILATQVFQFMNKHLLNNKSPYVWCYTKTGLAEQHMIILAAIIRDLDRETARTETGTISGYFGPTLGGLYSEFSQSLTRYTHNLLVCGILSESLQTTLLGHLGVNPWSNETSSWPLQVHPRTLAVLAQVLLLKQDSQKERACMNIWQRLVSELIYNVCTPPVIFEPDNEDLNVEHAQLVLFLFHSLNLMQKKSVLLMTAGGVLRCVETTRNPMKDTQILHLSRLLLLLDYLMRHLYDAPPVLLEQIQWNLFNATTMMVDNTESKDGTKLPSRIYCPWREIEDNYRELAPAEEMSLKPRFYCLTQVEVSNQDQPKLDGLACNFILGTPDKLDYPNLLNALIEILNITNQCREGLSYTGLCAVQYCFAITWRFLLLLPPSTLYLEQLFKGEMIEPGARLSLHSLVWGSRSNCKTFSGWMKDCLVRQGVPVQYSEGLVKGVAKTVNVLRYDVNLAKNVIKTFLTRISAKTEQLRLSELYLIDAVIAKIQVLMDDSISKTPESENNRASPPVETVPSHSELAQELLPLVISLAGTLLSCCKKALLAEIQSDDPVLPEVLALSSRWNPKTGSLGVALMGLVPPGVKVVAEKWNSKPICEFAWSLYANDTIPSESYILSIVNTHVSAISRSSTFSPNQSLQHVLYSAVTFIHEHINKCPEGSGIPQQAAAVILQLTMECSTEYIYMIALRTVEKILGESETDAHQLKVYDYVLAHTYQMILTHGEASAPVNDTYVQECLKFVEGLLEKPAGRQALENYFSMVVSGNIFTLLLSAANVNHSRQYSSKVCKFFLKLLSTLEKNPEDIHLQNLCKSLAKIADLDRDVLQTWLRHVILGPPMAQQQSPTPAVATASTPAPVPEPSPVIPVPVASTSSMPAASTSAGSATSAPTSSSSSALTDATPEIKEEFSQPQPVKNESPTKEEEKGKSTTTAEPTSETCSEKEDLQDHHELLKALTNYLTKETSVGEEVHITLLKAMIPIASEMLQSLEGVGFRELMTIMTQLAGTGKGHVHLLTASVEWLEIIKQQLTAKEVLTKLEDGAGPGKHKVMLDAACHLLSYVGDVVSALAPPNAGRATSPPWEGDAPIDQDPEFEDNVPHDDEDSGAEDSDEDSLCNKLCTFTITAKEFMNQHWYHCHTCNMVEGIGVCTVCARVCHRGHDITYAKYGNFFCDCGAKQDGSCQALTKRNPQTGMEPQPGPSAGTSNQQNNFGLEQMLQSSLRRRPSSPANCDRSERGHKDRAKLAALAKQLEGNKDALSALITNPSVVILLLDLVKSLLPAVKVSCDSLSPVGCHKRGQQEMKKLHKLEKKFEETDQLMLPTLGSQEGAFENVKMNYSGDQGATIRQLLSAHVIRRVAMCCLSSPHGKRQHLAVSHEKGKITVLQLSALLKQADSSKRKLTLTRLASAPIPFTVLSITGNPWNEDFLAVCGLKECHVVTFSSNGLVADHLVLHPQLDGGNFIIKAIWLPGSQTELALVTADFIKIYDLSKDAMAPKYFFLVPAGKVRDCTFYCNEAYENPYILVMTSAGYICTQEMNEESLAVHGPFFVMDVLETFHPEVKDVNGQVEGGGVSIYYSHTLQLLFFSYASGKSFVAPLTQIDKGYTGLPALFMISWGKNTTSAAATTTTTTTTGKGNAANTPQPLCQWSEVPNHPGLVFSVMLSSNNPVILMIKPDTILVQEIKVVPAKAKIMDMVAIRHPSSNAEHRTTLILLCEDGSLRIYMASMQQTGFWLSSAVQAITTQTPKQARKRKANTAQAGKPSGNLSFPVDFFEHCQPMADVEFGGNDLLQVYNAQQIKHRLSVTGMCVVSTKQTGFSVEVINSDPSLVMTGIRVFFNYPDAARTPAYIEIFGRSIHTNAARSRWFDIPFTREESLLADKKMTITFGPSADPESVIMVDSIKVYGKTKDTFGWPEETEEITNNVAPSTSAAGTAPSTSEGEAVSTSPAPPTALEKMVSGILEVLDGCFILLGSAATDETKAQKHRVAALEVALSLMTLTTPVAVQLHAKALLSALFSTKFAYHFYKDCALLKHAYLTLLEFKELSDPKEIDPEAFYRLVLTVRSVAVARPYNLTKFHENMQLEPRSPSTEEAGSSTSVKKTTKSQFISDLMYVLWQLLEVAPRNPARAPVCKPGLTHTEAVVQALVEIFHAFTLCDLDGTIAEAAKQYSELLLSDNLLISFSAKQALVRVLRPRPKRRRVFIPSPPHCSTPGGTTEMESEKGPVSQPSQDSSEADQAHFEVDAPEPMVLLPAEAGNAAAAAAANVHPLEAILAAQGGFPPLIDIPPDADDETMVELAIALSLQDHDNMGELPILQGGLPPLGNLNLQGLHVLAGQGQAAGNQEAGHYSDTTASAGGSDDEGSTAATDGSTLRTSPAEQVQGGSESGGSGVESITGEQNVSGRSSAYGDSQEPGVSGARSDATVFAALETETETESWSSLHELRITVLQHLVARAPILRMHDGVHVIPFMQVLLMLTADLDGEEEKDKSVLEDVLKTLDIKETLDVTLRTPEREVHLVVMRLLSVLMSRNKANANSNFVSMTTADYLLHSGVIKYCHQLLQELLRYWKSTGNEEGGSTVSGALLKPHMTTSPPDMSPFFLQQYVKGHANDVFEAYPQLLTEMALRLPYQIQKHVETISPISENFDNTWYAILCEYMMTYQTPFVRRQVRKLLLFLCGHKEKYRHLRDVHGLDSHILAVEESCKEGGYVSRDPNSHISLHYDALVEIIEHLKACVEVATYRTANWQSFCLARESTLATLLELSCLLDDGVAPTILQLLQCGLCCNKVSEPNKDDADGSALLVSQINRLVSKDLFSRFLRTFLLETNATSIRWQAHALVLAIYQNSPPAEQESLLNLLWKLWPQLPAYGRKAAQFVDLLGYFSLKASQADKKAQLTEYTQHAVNLLRKQNQLLSHHPNASLYTSLAQYVELDGYYLESEPCLVCNSPEVPFSSIKLSAIKIDSKFTTTTQFVKLVSSHTISKITLRIGDLKRTKMVRTINVFYNNRTVQSVVELKSKLTVWHRAKKVSLVSGQTEVKMEFPLPIVACNLMIEYSDFYENIQATSETLQCPRCSASVPANPGVCGNCGENVFQCHKCRAINYDERDPFLCHSCGFCKYAKFDYTLTARPCCAVDPIEDDEDRNKTVAAINAALEKADRVYRSLIANKPGLELLIMRISEHRQEKAGDNGSLPVASSSSTTTVSSSGSTQINKAIQLLAQRYCGECKNSFDDLSKMIQRVVACRRELVAYDRNQREKGKVNRGPALMSTSLSHVALGADAAPGRCYGCATAAADHCLTLLRALASSPPSRQLLCQEGLIEELVKNNLRKNPVQIQELLCLLTRDNIKATQSLCSLLMDRITLTLKGHVSNSDLAFAVRHEMALLAALVQKEDTCWEHKLRCVMQLLFTASRDAQSPVVLESITLPCLKILHSIMKPTQPISKKNKDKGVDALASVIPQPGIRVDVRRWMEGDERHSFGAWSRRMPSKAGQHNFPDTRSAFLSEKYATRWRQNALKDVMPVVLSNNAPWLKQVLFNPSSRLSRQVACNMLESLCQVSIRKREIIDLLTGYLSELGQAGESAAEFLSLYQNLLQQPPWKQYLAVKGLLLQIAEFLTKEIQELHRLEDTSLTSDLAQGYALKMLTELLASFLDHSSTSIKQMYKGRLVGAVLNGYLSLRRLVVQRTRLIDDTQEKLLELLEEMTTGTEEETKAFMAICIETVKSQDPEDIRTPVFIFERLCSIIYPEENDTGEFFLTLEKDPQQEDFLQGRMLGNPYSSNEPGLGPLMRDVKNKICQDCELVALLEDDTGMELLVNNKIISLNLPVREVYKRVWLGEGGDIETMRVIYRMRGLLGDATEEFVETLSAKTETEVNNEEVYKMANVMAECGGLMVMLDRLSSISDLSRARPLLQVLLKLFRLCVKVKRNQEVLTQPELNAISVFLNVLNGLCASKESSASQIAITQELLEIMETILSKATSEPAETFYKFAQTFGDQEHISALLRFTAAGNNLRPSMIRHLMRVVAALTYGNETRMEPLVKHFTSVLDFNAFDAEHTTEDEAKLELFCVLTSAIERNTIGNTLKDYIVSLGIVNRALEYILAHASTLQSALTDVWKEFISKPSLKYILRFLTGLATEHEKTQVAVAADSIPVIHRLEQVSSDEHVGSLAENLLEALRSNVQVATRIEEVRELTRAEKKRLAMAMRERQLGALGMRTNDKGQVTADQSIMQQVEDLGEETGHTCVICREGYKFQPCKVLGIYTYTKKSNVEEYETKPRKTVGYTTVTHFNVVHVDCHMAAVRLARARDEWESAALQNGNTKCNGLLPLWGPHVPESAFASCLARHNTYLQECTGHRDISYSSMVHDLKLLLLRFSQEKSFHEDTGGGGPQSNMYIVPYLLHITLYVINTTRSGPREEKTISCFLECSSIEKKIESCYEAEGPMYMTALSLLLVSPARWTKVRVSFLSRLIVMAQARHVTPSGPTARLPDVSVKDYSVYKSALLFFALVDGIYSNFFKTLSVSSEEQWPSQLADYIRHNDEAMMKASDKLLAAYREELLPCASFDEFCDVVGLLNQISDPNAFLTQLLSPFA